jgi:hypothetical protein
MSDVKFFHMRPEDVKDSPKGGVTVAFIDRTPEKDAHTAHRFDLACAWCHPADNYNKKLGRAKAEGRLKSLNWVWEITCVPSALYEEVRQGLYE